MKREYDLSKGKRGPVVPLPPEKVRITIRLDRTSLISSGIRFARTIGATIRP